MTWFVGAVSPSVVVAAEPTVVRREVSRFLSGRRDFRPGAVITPPSPDETLSALAADPSILSTLHVDVRPGTAPGTTRLAVFGGFWGDVTTASLTAPSPDGRLLCQATVDGAAAALTAHLHVNLRAGLSGTGLE